jgi:hypothetical protein
MGNVMSTADHIQRTLQNNGTDWMNNGGRWFRSLAYIMNVRMKCYME